MSNYPLGAENDPRAPYNDSSEDVIEQVIENAVTDIVNDIDYDIQQRLMDDSRAAVRDNLPNNEWQDYVYNIEEDVVSEVYDRVRERFLKAFNI